MQVTVYMPDRFKKDFELAKQACADWNRSLSDVLVERIREIARHQAECGKRARRGKN